MTSPQLGSRESPPIERIALRQAPDGEIVDVEALKQAMPIGSSGREPASDRALAAASSGCVIGAGAPHVIKIEEAPRAGAA